MEAEAIVLESGSSVVVKIGECAIRVTHMVDRSGDHALEISGDNCRLEGEMPGLYYPSLYEAPKT